MKFLYIFLHVFMSLSTQLKIKIIISNLICVYLPFEVSLENNKRSERKEKTHNILNNRPDIYKNIPGKNV